MLRPAFAVHAHRHGAGLDGGHRAEIAAGYAQLFIPCRELKAVPSHELARCFLVKADQKRTENAYKVSDALITQGLIVFYSRSAKPLRVGSIPTRASKFPQ